MLTSTHAMEVHSDAKLDYNQGIDFYKLGMYERAIESFRSAIRLCPDYIDDRTICFKGDYTKTLDEIDNFKVYWKD